MADGSLAFLVFVVVLVVLVYKSEALWVVRRLAR